MHTLGVGEPGDFCLLDEAARALQADADAAQVLLNVCSQASHAAASRCTSIACNALSCVVHVLQWDTAVHLDVTSGAMFACKLV
jgi:hypothetical protein